MKMKTVISNDELPLVAGGREFEGYLFGDVGVTFIIENPGPGDGPKLHSHPYAEVFVVHEGTVTFTLGESEIDASGGQIVIVPPETPHKFINRSDRPARQTAIHANNRFVTEWLED
jgi:mannose-6-phosphate isomerase-like protein (cupin superfamily)